MASSTLILFFFISIMTSSISLTMTSPMSSNHTYLVYMDPTHKPSIHPTYLTWFTSHLLSLSIPPSTSLLYTYPSLLPSLFSARLLPHHLPLLLSSPSLLLLLPDPLLSLHTTRSPSFLHLPSPPLPPSPSPSADVIVGVLDTGVWPELPSFSDHAFPPVPYKWKGECESGVDFSPSLCNRKLIGARSFHRAAAANDNFQNSKALVRIKG